MTATGTEDIDREYQRRLFDRRLAARAPQPQPPIETSLAKGEPDPGDGPTPQRLAMAGEDIEHFTPAEAEHHRTVRLNDRTPIDKMRRRMLITADQYNAGCRYYQDWFKAGLSTERAQDYSKERVDGGGYKDISDTVLAAQTRYNNALKVLDYDASVVLREVVLLEKDLRQYSSTHAEFLVHRERRSIALYLLRKGLSQLAMHYWPPRRDGLRSQMEPGARPVIMVADEASE